MSGGERVERETAQWVYYVNEENRARWKCSKCGKICRKDPTLKYYCSNCGAKMVKDSGKGIYCL